MVISKEIHRRVFELTLALYRVTDFFPQGEVLRKHLREKANEIFGAITEYGYNQATGQEAAIIVGRIQAIKGFLRVARSMRFVRPINITVLEKEFDFLADFFNKEIGLTKPGEHRQEQQNGDTATTTEELPTWNEFSYENKFSGVKNEQELSSIAPDINERQKKILEHLQQTPSAKISDLQPTFAEISSKTIQRDLQDLVTKNVLKKQGEKRWTTYSLR